MRPIIHHNIPHTVWNSRGWNRIESTVCINGGPSKAEQQNKKAVTFCWNLYLCVFADAVLLIMPLLIAEEFAI